MTSNIFSIANKIFSKPPQLPKSIQFILEEANLNTIFELLVLFLLEGISIKFTNEDLQKLDDLDDEQLYDKVYFKFREYFVSMGFNIFLKIMERQKLNYRKYLTFFPDKEYNVDLCTFIRMENNVNDHQVFFEYVPALKSPDLKDYMLIISTGKYMLNITFDFFLL